MAGERNDGGINPGILLAEGNRLPALPSVWAPDEKIPGLRLLDVNVGRKHAAQVIDVLPAQNSKPRPDVVLAETRAAPGHVNGDDGELTQN
jgi:hypothetical protein